MRQRLNKDNVYGCRIDIGEWDGLSSAVSAGEKVMGRKRCGSTGETRTSQSSFTIRDFIDAQALLDDLALVRLSRRGAAARAG